VATAKKSREPSSGGLSGLGRNLEALIIKTNGTERTVFLVSSCGVSINVLQECHTYRQSIIILNQNCFFTENVLQI
jgi:hypothetical protein